MTAKTSSRSPHDVDEPVCVVTRIICPSHFFLLRAILLFFRLRRLARRSLKGFVDASCWIRTGRTFMMVSIWQDEMSTVQFTTLREHVDAVRWVVAKEAEVWSANFRVKGTSSRSRDWIGRIHPWEPGEVLPRVAE